MTSINIDSKNGKLFLQSMQYSSRERTDTAIDLNLGSRLKISKMSTKSREILPISSEQFDLSKTDHTLTRTGFSRNKGDSVADALRKRKN